MTTNPEVETVGRGGATITSPGETEAGSAGCNHAEGQLGGLHRDDDRQRRNEVLALLPNPSSDRKTQFLENPRPKGRNTH
jgi:hypothetical protein